MKKKKVRGLSPKHYRKFIKGSAISDKVARTRKYWTITTQTQVEKLCDLGFYEYQIRRPGLLIPIWGVNGEHVSYQYRPDDPRVDRRSGKPCKYENLPGSHGYLDIHPSNVQWLRKTKHDLWITEGIRKADALTSAGAFTLGLYGVWNWRGMDEGGAICRLPEWDEIALNRVTYVVFDSDVMVKPAVQKALERLGRWLEMRGSEVWYIYLEDIEGEKQGIDDYLARGYDLDELIEKAEDTVRGLPTVAVGGDQLRDTTQDVLRTLIHANNPEPQVFQRGMDLLRIPLDSEGVPIVEPFTSVTLRGHMSLVADYVRLTSNNKRVNVWPPTDLPGQVLGMPEKDGIPTLKGITESPTIRPDGSILDHPGYDSVTQLVHVPSRDLEVPGVPDRPTLKDRRDAIRMIDKLLTDFPFESDADRANTYAFLLTPILRPAV